MTEKTKRGYLIPLRVVLDAAKQGVKLQQLQDMVGRSARVTHELGNRRFHDYVFMIEGNRVLSMQHLVPVDDIVEDEIIYRCVACKDTGHLIVFDECPHCEGVGCKHCDQGLVRNQIPCQSCGRKSTSGVFSKKTFDK
jgi:RecJ-like exonuclease